MKKNYKLTLIIIVIILIGYSGPTLFRLIIYGHKSEVGVYRYMRLFKDSIRKDIDTTYGGIGIVTKKDIYYVYTYCKSGKKLGFTAKDTVYNITFWEFKDLAEIDLKNILIKRNTLLYGIKIKYANVYNRSVSYLPIITSELGFKFANNKMEVNLDNATDIYKTFDTINFKGFLGKINKMVFSNDKEDPLILFEYNNASRALFLMYKTKYKFIAILVNCNHDELIDENIINMFNLK